MTTDPIDDYIDAVSKPLGLSIAAHQTTGVVGCAVAGALNMEECPCYLTRENSHDGPSPNPHDVTRMTGGSSGGSGSAVGGALVPLALGSDTNGSIRVPSSF